MVILLCKTMTIVTWRAYNTWSIMQTDTFFQCDMVPPACTNRIRLSRQIFLICDGKAGPPFVHIQFLTCQHTLSCLVLCHNIVLLTNLNFFLFIHSRCKTYLYSHGNHSNSTVANICFSFFITKHLHKYFYIFWEKTYCAHAQHYKSRKRVWNA